MHVFGGLTPAVIDAMSVEDFRALCRWADAWNKQQEG